MKSYDNFFVGKTYQSEKMFFLPLDPDSWYWVRSGSLSGKSFGKNSTEQYVCSTVWPTDGTLKNNYMYIFPTTSSGLSGLLPCHPCSSESGNLFVIRLKTEIKQRSWRNRARPQFKFYAKPKYLVREWNAVLYGQTTIMLTEPRADSRWKIAGYLGHPLAWLPRRENTTNMGKTTPAAWEYNFGLGYRGRGTMITIPQTESYVCKYVVALISAADKDDHATGAGYGLRLVNYAGPTKIERCSTCIRQILFVVPARMHRNMSLHSFPPPISLIMCLSDKRVELPPAILAADHLEMRDRVP